MYHRRHYFCVCNWGNNSKQKTMKLKNKEKKFHIIFFKDFFRHKQGDFEMLCFSRLKNRIERRICYICTRIKSYSEMSSCKIRVLCGMWKGQCSENPLGEANS